MSPRDRFTRASMMRAALSWRTAVGVGVGAAMWAAGLPPAVAVTLGAAVSLGLVATAVVPRSPAPPRIDPFAVGEPWRQFVQGAQRAATRLHDTVDGAPSGPLRDRMLGIAAKLDRSLDETWRIAQRGHEIDAMITRLDPPALHAKLEALRRDRADEPGDEIDAAIESIEGQLESTDRLKSESARAAKRLRLTQTRLDELVTRAAEVAVGAGDTDAYEHDVDDLVIELEALRQAVDETNR